MFSKSLRSTNYLLSERLPSIRLPPSRMKDCLSLNNQWALLLLLLIIIILCEMSMCHWPKELQKLIIEETYFLVVIGVALIATSLPAFHMLHWHPIAK